MTTTPAAPETSEFNGNTLRTTTPATNAQIDIAKIPYSSLHFQQRTIQFSTGGNNTGNNSTDGNNTLLDTDGDGIDDTIDNCQSDANLFRLTQMVMA